MGSVLALLCAVFPLVAAPPPSQQIVKHFDFDETQHGNYDELPMRWVQLQGPGLPHYSTGRLDRALGHEAPPSLRLDLQGGNVALEYQHNDIRVAPNSDYCVEAFVRTAGLRESCAFLSAFLVDRTGKRLPGAAAVCDLVPALTAQHVSARRNTASSTPAVASRPGAAPDARRCNVAQSEAGDWHARELFILNTPPEAYALRLQVWIAQNQAWRTPRPGTVDPIIREDVRGTAWFDDLTVYRLPQVRLECGNPAGLITVGRAAELRLAVQNPGPVPLDAQLVVENEQGQVVAEFSGKPTGLDSTQQTFSLRPLPIGAYTATAYITASGTETLSRSLRFLVLGDLSDDGARHDSFGIDLGRFAGGETAGLIEAVRELHAGAVRIGVPMLPEVTQPQEIEYFDELRDAVASLASRQVDVCGVMLGPIDEMEHTTFTARQLANPPEMLSVRLGPVLARLGGILPTWQLGEEAVELASRSQWDRETLRRLAREFERFVMLPRFVQPRALLDGRHQADFLRDVAPERSGTAAGVAASGPSSAPSSAPASASLRTILQAGPHVEALSILVPADLPSRALPWQLAFLTPTEEVDRPHLRGGQVAPAAWLTFPPPREDGAHHEALTELAYRIIFSRALGVERAYFPAPWQLSTRNGSGCWEPTDAFPVMRTLFRNLAGMTAHNVFQLPGEAIGILFHGSDEDCLVAWSWAYGPPQVSREFDLGDSAQALDCWGRPVAIRQEQQRTEFPIGRMPLILTGVDRALVQLQAGLSIAPRRLRPDDPSPALMVRVQNPYDQQIAATARLDAPKGWSFTPQEFELVVAAGASDERQVHVQLPPISEAGEENVRLTLELRQPVARTLRFSAPIEIGLENIRVSARAAWRGGTLVVQQTMRNESEQPIHFAGFCQAPGYRRQTGAFLNLGPGDARVQEYVFPAAARLAGMQLVLGVEELEGRRKLSQRVLIPTPFSTTQPVSDARVFQSRSNASQPAE